MDKKTVFKWLSGLWAGIFVGALAACPAKEVSLPVSLFLAVAFGYLGK